jgi:hypothetical protein
MVGSKNCNDHRNHGGDLVEVEFNAVHVPLPLKPEID